jgi:hypothetical protein
MVFCLFFRLKLRKNTTGDQLQGWSFGVLETARLTWGRVTRHGIVVRGEGRCNVDVKSKRSQTARTCGVKPWHGFSAHESAGDARRNCVAATLFAATAGLPCRKKLKGRGVSGRRINAAALCLISVGLHLNALHARKRRNGCGAIAGRARSERRLRTIAHFICSLESAESCCRRSVTGCFGRWPCPGPTYRPDGAPGPMFFSRKACNVL